MTRRREEANQLLKPEVLLRMVTYLVNAKFPSKWEEHTEGLSTNAARGSGPTPYFPSFHLANRPALTEVVYDPGEKPEFIAQLREMTQRYWPELWENEVQAAVALKRIQKYLRLFWKEADPHARDWYMLRARHTVYRLRVQRQVSHVKLASVNDVLHLNAQIEDLMDNPPERVPFEEALYQLQQRALIPSRRPLYCHNTNCGKPPYEHGHPYFLSEKKGTKFCSPECARPTLLASKRKYANNPERRKK